MAFVEQLHDLATLKTAICRLWVIMRDIINVQNSGLYTC